MPIPRPSTEAPPSSPRPSNPSRHRTLQLLGQGGMGAVYRVRDEARGIDVALKRLERGGASEADRLRFRREFHTLAQLAHPGVVQVFEYGIDDAGPWYTMELLEGQDLAELGTLPPERGLRVLREVAETLAFLHSRRLVHRDLAPRNVRFDARGHAKLIDFGILATVGTPGEVAGTPPYMAPESLRGLPLDHRADLFGLGALAYRVLTGRHAFPAKQFGELEALWSRPVTAPSSVAPGLSPDVDRLVLSLLSVDPLRRPRSAAEVVDRLDAALGTSTPAGARRAAAEGFLASTALVGRHREVALIRRVVEQAVAGQGDAVLIEGPVGSGKSRLLRELGLEAQLAGLLAVRAQADAGSRTPYAVLRALVRGLFAVAAEDAAQAAAPFREDLARLPEIAERLGVPVTAPLVDPTEQRLRLHAALSEWLRAFAQRRALALLVDDLHACDEASAAVLLLLGKEAPGLRLVVGLAGGTDQPLRAPDAIAALRRTGQRLRLRGLAEAEVEELLEVTFGQGPELKRLARWMHGIAGGSPLHTTELARQLVARGVLHYDGGLWVVPVELPRDPPNALVAALGEHLSELSAPARALAESLSVCEGELPIALCVRLSGEPDEAKVFVALDELLQRDVLAGGGECYRFPHEALRDALWKGLPEARQRALHLAAGRALAALPDAGERQAEVGWHLLRGGEEREGARLLESCGRRLFDAQSFDDAIEPLEAALQVYERHGASPATILDLKYKLLFCGSISNREVAVRYMEPAVLGLFEAAGLPLAQRLTRWMGPFPALLVGLGVAAVRRWLSPPCRRSLPPVTAVITFALSCASAATVSALMQDTVALRRWISLAEAVTFFKDKVGYALLLFMKNLEAFADGRWRELEDNVAVAMRIYETDKTSRIPELARRVGEGCMRVTLTTVYAAQQQAERFAQEIAAVEKLGLRMFDGHLALGKAFFHRMRGEEEQAQQYDAQAELLFLQLGAVWGAQVQRIVTSGLCYALTRDVLGMKRAIEELSRLLRAGLKVDFMLETLRGEYHRERGEHAEAKAALERAVALAPDALKQGIIAALAEAHLAAGEVESALAKAREAAARSNPQLPQVLASFRSERVLALAEAAAGELSAATQRLDALSRMPEVHAQPVFVGMLHEARATLALMRGDAAAYRLSCLELECCYAPTRNPALLARVQRLLDAGAVRSVAPAPAELASEAVTVVRKHELAVGAVLAGCRGPAERAARALELLVWESGGTGGYLYLLRGGSLALAAPLTGEEPPDAVTRALERLVEQWEGNPVTLPAALPGIEGSTRWHPLLLTVDDGGKEAVVGAAAIGEGVLRYREVAPALVDDVAQVLWQAGDATTRTRSR